MIQKDELIPDTYLENRKSTWNLICLTLGLGGLQCIFAVQFGNGSEYLTSLGISKPLLAMVWLAGPISGAFLQPYFCLRSDECQSKWGRRRPFIAGGGAAIIISLLGQAWVPDLISAATSTFGSENGSKTFANVTAATVILFVIALNVAIQPVQGCLRALIVDSCVKDEQDAANAWAGRVISIANVWSYVCGYVDLPSWFPYFGNTQFKVLCSVTSIWLGISIAVTCWTTTEAPVVNNKASGSNKEWAFRRLGGLLGSFRHLPLQLQRVCMIQFFAWLGWFPFLFYIDLYISDKYLASHPGDTSQSTFTTTQSASKTGSLGMLIFAIISLLASIAIPTLTRLGDRFQRHMHHQISPSKSQFLEMIYSWKIDIRGLWMISHMIYATCMLATILISSVTGTYALVGIAGISWAVTIWAPFAIISIEISADDDIHQNTNATEYPQATSSSESKQRVGTVIGLHNIAIAVPQILAALLCGFIFWVFDGSGSVEPEKSVGWVLRMGGASALVAAFLTIKLDHSAETEYRALEEV
ncbi:major facilitator superfamily domain-containing protein [Tricladium varicosporioides]|nr:major facilitator superfamily domain-containing protein [Hymenoscyphus varicosporioides]